MGDGQGRAAVHAAFREVRSKNVTHWVHSRDGSVHGYAMARRHYSSWKNPRPKQRKFVGPGEAMVLSGMFINALFCWRKSLYRLDSQTGVECTIFRNESPVLSSVLIAEAVDLARQRWPEDRLFTMVDPKRIRSTNPGFCFLQAGWSRCGRSGRGLVILEKLGV